MARQQRYLEYFAGSLAGLAIGDAIGMPVETMTPTQILEATDGKGVQGPLEQIFQWTRDEPRKPPGTTTDDTQLAYSLADALIATHGVDLKEIARRLVAEFRADRFGWGGTTKRSTAAMAEWFDSDGARGRSPYVHLETEPPRPPAAFDDRRCGNGVAMRIAPLGLFLGTIGARDEDLIRTVMAVGKQTHDDPRASVAGVAMAKAVAHVLYHGVQDGPSRAFFRDEVLRVVHMAAERYCTAPPTDLTGAPPNAFAPWATAHELGVAIAVVEDIVDRFERTFSAAGSDVTTLRSVAKTGAHALESVPFALAMFVREPTDFKRAVLDTVNAGGDTDTTAAMVGALVGANVGLPYIPFDWQVAVPNTSVGISLGRVLCEIAIGFHRSKGN